jgi:hypothetical protein
MRTIYQQGKASIVAMREAYGEDYYVYDGDKLIRVCPSEGMAREIVAGL